MRTTSAAAGDRAAGPERHYLTRSRDGDVPEAVSWQPAVHDPGIYDLEVDRAWLSPDECAHAIRNRPRGRTSLDSFRAVGIEREGGPDRLI